MGTAGGEPRVLLNALKPMLGVVGDIKTPQEVMRVVGMMKDAEKLMSRCVYLNILKATCRQAMQNEEKRETLQKFLATGGWGILNKWLFEFTKSENFPVLLELIEVLKVLPITVDLLKQGNTGKLIKQMTKLEHSDVKKNSAGLIKKWKDMIMKKKPGQEHEKSDSSANIRDSDEKLKRKLGDLPGGKQVADSSGFINALAAAASVPVKKKRRTSTENVKKATLPLDEILKSSNENKQSKTEGDADRVEQLGSPEPDDDEEKSSYGFRSPAVEAANQALAEDNSNGVVIDEGSLARKRNKKKRNITWAPDEELVQISYFELMEGEKKGHHNENFSQARQLELMFEKQALRGARRGEDRMVEKMQWCRLIPVDNAGVPNFMAGEKSREKFIQGEREKTVLAYIFLTKQSLPDNPTEPDFDPQEHNNRSQPRMIPHDEDGTILPPSKTIKPSHHYNMSSNISNQGSSMSAIQSTKSEPSKSSHSASVSPAVQNIMSQLLRNNGPNEQQQKQQPHPPQPQQQNKPPQPMNFPMPLPNMPNMPSILGQPGMVPPMMPPFPNPMPGMNQPGPKNMNSSMNLSNVNAGNVNTNNMNPNNMNPNNLNPNNMNPNNMNPNNMNPNNNNMNPNNMNPNNMNPNNMNPNNMNPNNMNPNNLNQNNMNNSNINNSNFVPPAEPLMLMDTPAMRGRGGIAAGPRFSGARPPFNHNGPVGGEAGFNKSGGPVPRPRWDGPPNQGPPNRNGNWNQNDNFHNENFDDNYNEGFDENYNEDNNFGNDGFRGRGRGFRRGMNNRGRGNSDRGRGNSDRGRYHNNRGYDGSHRGKEWHRDDRNNKHFPSRGRDRNIGPDGSRRDDRSKVPCQHFGTPRGCRNGDRCKFSHATH